MLQSQQPKCHLQELRIPQFDYKGRNLFFIFCKNRTKKRARKNLAPNSFPFYSSPKLGEVPVRAVGSVSFPLSDFRFQISAFRFPLSVLQDSCALEDIVHIFEVVLQGEARIQLLASELRHNLLVLGKQLLIVGTLSHSTHSHRLYGIVSLLT